MKNLVYSMLFVSVACFVTGCGNKQEKENGGNDSVDVFAVTDSALYGKIGEGSSMHMLELIGENENTSTYSVDVDMEADIQGGILSGDRVTLTTTKAENGEVAVVKMVNLTSLCGKWVSLDRNFEIKDDGTVESHQNAESRPYTHWSMCNCNLVLNKDTFAIGYLGADSLTLENNKGIFAYKRVK